MLKKIIQKKTNEFLADLKINKPKKVEPTKVEYYHGVEGLKKIYQKTLNANKPIYAISAVIPEIDKEFYHWAEEYYIPERTKKKIFAKVIAPANYFSSDYAQQDQKYYRKTLLIPQDKFPISIEINIFGNNVALTSFKSNELLGVLIKSKEIAQTMKVFFNLAWERGLDYQEEMKKRF
ncbi:MAG: hypothetical protein COX77_04110 [Candidatus Komeilibacteria bacterium CG_4_10_14_0_2_um_filter_37_10]|uniref:Uncharacterized protein n=1 Tax=Candidatus Komeilibacteria bacterium CG_4_10_14_0_2_um_filter_37_10 TaxID=1974470 RepID=A0A2M7VDQ0_9BACT|nr:MAG: hypothetical protein COX77_04110 [Candidatus Komeilibacteria bacterium CG_4_10_14_0_2_um_filter_37_10]